MDCLKKEEKEKYSKTYEGRYQLEHAINGKTKKERVEAASKTLAALYISKPTTDGDCYNKICKATAASYKSNLTGKDLGADIAKRVLAVGGLKLDGTPLNPM